MSHLHDLNDNRKKQFDVLYYTLRKEIYFSTGLLLNRSQLNQRAFLTNSDFKFISPKPSILQEILCPSPASVR